MGTDHIFSKIKSRFNSFTQAEKKVAQFILDHTQEVIYMSITDLAIACEVGESSVFRFCKSLDLKGYQEFKIALAHSLSSENENTQLYNEVSVTDSVEELSSKLLTTTMTALKETYQLIQKEELMKAIQWMVNATSIHFFGVGSSLLTALEAQNKFMRITNKTNCTLDSHLQLMSAALMSANDVAIVISYSGSTKDTIDVAKVAKEKGAKVITITRFAKSPLTAYGDVTLLSAADEGPLQGGSLTAKISQLYLLDILYGEYFKQTVKVSAENKEKTAQAVVDKLL